MRKHTKTLYMKTKLLFLALITTNLLSAAPPVEEGKSIFSARCAGCHNVNKVLTGPALAGIDQRRSIDWIVSFVQSSQNVIKKGDKEAIALFEKFNKIPMPDHSDLSPEKIKSILEYIKTEAAVASQPKEEAPIKQEAAPLTFNDYLMYSILAGAVLLLIAALFFWIKVRSMAKRSTLSQ